MTDFSNMPALVVDMDGTLIHTDTLVEQLIGLWNRKPLIFLKAVLKLPFQSRSQFKEEISQNIEIDASLVPYNKELLDYLQQEKSEGRKIFLVTAAHVSVANSVAAHLGIFDGVYATTGDVNLKGTKKAEFLIERFGDQKFIYAGDSRSDIHVWKHAKEAVLVGNVKRLNRLVKVPVRKVFPREKTVPHIFKQIRVYQWVKNFLVFVPIFASGEITSTGKLYAAFISFLAFSFTASSAYIINDLLDLESDRNHSRKRTRPFASGSLPLVYGVILAPILLCSGLGISFWLDPMLGLIVLGYFILTTWYSIHLKTLPLVDVFALAALYSIRIVGGGAATDILPSTWLLSFSGSLFLSLAFLKRYIETSAVEQSKSDLSRRGYEVGESAIQMTMGMAAGFSSVIVFSIWLDSAAFRANYSSQFMLWMVTPLLLLWQCRLWLSAFRGKMHDDPIVYTAKDRVSWMIFGMCGVFYGLGLSL